MSWPVTRKWLASAEIVASHVSPRCAISMRPLPVPPRGSRNGEVRGRLGSIPVAIAQAGTLATRRSEFAKRLPRVGGQLSEDP